MIWNGFLLVCSTIVVSSHVTTVQLYIDYRTLFLRSSLFSQPPLLLHIFTMDFADTISKYLQCAYTAPIPFYICQMLL